MRAPSENWFKEIEQSRDSVFNEENNGTFPIYPWLAPALDPKLRSLIERWGVVKELNAREPVLGEITDKVDQLVLVRSGITARIFGSLYHQSSPAMAFSVPGRLACGNLNFFSHRPCIGSYVAVVPSVVVTVPQSLVMSMCRSDTDFALLVASEFEKISLSDRLGFGLLAQLDNESRFLAFLLSWAVTFGHVEMVDDEDWVRMPLPLRGDALRAVLNCSSATLDRCLAALKQKGDYVVEGDVARVRLARLKPINRLIRNFEERTNEPPRIPLMNLFDCIF